MKQEVYLVVKREIKDMLSIVTNRDFMTTRELKILLKLLNKHDGGD